MSQDLRADTSSRLEPTGWRYRAAGVKTRTLLLLALGCGVAIMLAGALLLFQLATRDDIADAVPIGASTQVGDVTATVIGFAEADRELTVEVRLDAPPDIDPTTGFRLIASGRALVPDGVACTDVCSVSFDVSDADGTSRVLFYARGDHQARWVLG